MWVSSRHPKKSEADRQMHETTMTINANNSWESYLQYMGWQWASLSQLKLEPIQLNGIMDFRMLTNHAKWCTWVVLEHKASYLICFCHNLGSCSGLSSSSWGHWKDKRRKVSQGTSWNLNFLIPVQTSPKLAWAPWGTVPGNTLFNTPGAGMGQWKLFTHTGPHWRANVVSSISTHKQGITTEGSLIDQLKFPQIKPFVCNMASNYLWLLNNYICNSQWFQLRIHLYICLEIGMLSSRYVWLEWSLRILISMPLNKGYTKFYNLKNLPIFFFFS